MNRTHARATIALGLFVPLSLTPAMAEQHTAQTGDTTGTMSQTEDSNGASQEERQAADVPVVSVGQTIITAADVQFALQAFPEQIRSAQPAETLIPIAIQQLVLRELVLQDGKAQNLGEDEEVQQILGDNAERSEDDVIVQVYIQRELEEAVTDEAVQDTYDSLSQQSNTEVPPLDAVRPQIEQQLRQERLNEIGAALQEEIDVVFYGRDGNPMETDAPADNAASESSTGVAPLDQPVENAPETDGVYGNDENVNDNAPMEQPVEDAPETDGAYGGSTQN